jgi:hypothetical protein
MVHDTLSEAALSMGGPVARQPERVGAGGARTEGGPLGIIARFASPDKFWGVSQQVHRFALQAAARELVPCERVATCLRRPIPTRPTIDVLYAPAVQSAHYSGLQVCGSVWMCPVCASKITERRRVEMREGFTRWLGRRLLVTFTLQHTVKDDLSDVLAGLLNSYRSLRSGKWWPAFEVRHGLVGSVRSTEVTYGSNGWHPHLHVLMLVEGEVAVIPFEEELKSRWAHQLARSGRYSSWLHGVDVRFSDADIAGYIAKFGRESQWTIEHEMTKTPVKAGRGGSRSPMQLLGEYLMGDERAGRLWLQYAVNFKGKKQLVWSRGLRERLGLIEEKTDEEVVMQEDEIGIVLASLTRDQWRVVLGNDARGELLQIASQGDAQQVEAFLLSLGAGHV